MKKETKEELISALDALGIQLDRVIKSSELIPEPTDNGDIQVLIDEIITLTKRLMRLS